MEVGWDDGCTCSLICVQVQVVLFWFEGKHPSLIHVAADFAHFKIPGLVARKVSVIGCLCGHHGDG